MQFAECSLKMVCKSTHIRHEVLTFIQLDEVINLEGKRQRETLWTPVQHLFRWDADGGVSESTEKDDEENPGLVFPVLRPLSLTDFTWVDLVQGIETHEHWVPQRRDPDALPPKNTFGLIASYIHTALASLLGGNALYAIKAGILTGTPLLFCTEAMLSLPIVVVLCIPSFLKSTGGFAASMSLLIMIFKSADCVANRA